MLHILLVLVQNVLWYSMWGRSSMGYVQYVLSTKQVVCPRLGWYGRSSSQNMDSFDSGINAILALPVGASRYV